LEMISIFIRFTIIDIALAQLNEKFNERVIVLGNKTREELPNLAAAG